jgi:hypothetical protein
LVVFGTGAYKLDTNEKDEVYFVKAVNIRNDTIWDLNEYSDTAFTATYRAHGMEGGGRRGREGREEEARGARGKR